MNVKPPSAAELATALSDHSTALIKSLRVNSTALAENSTALIKSLRVKVLDSAELVKSLRMKVQDTAALLKSLKKGERLALVAVGSAAAATAVVLLWRRRRRLPPPPPPAVALEDIAKYPGRAAVGVIDAPKSLAFAPGDAAVTYLASPPGSTSQKLYSLDLASGTVSELLADDRTDESTYTAEEKLRRERLRMLHTGVTEYSWSTEGGVMLVPQGSRSLVAIRTSLGGAPVALFDADAKGSPLPAGEPCLDARLSKDGAFCGFVCGGEVFVCSTTGTSAPVQVTHGAKAAGVTHGVASFVAQEEMDRMEGWWLSPDASLLAFEEVDERGVPTFTIPHHVPDPHASETHRYPFAGADNPRARLGIVKVRGRAEQKVVWLKMPEQKHPGYICRVAWRDEKQLFVQTQSRRQDEVRLLAVDAASGRATLLLTERATNYVNLHDCLIPLANGAFVWASEASGYNHLAVHEADGKRRVALTSGAWVVDSTGSQMLDAKSEVLYFVGNRGDATQQHLYRVSLAGGADAEQLTVGDGTHDATLSRNFERFIDRYSALDAPPVIRVCDAKDGSVLREVFHSEDPALLRLRPHLAPPELTTIPSADGAVTLHVALYRPSKAFGTGPWPLVVFVYGGPHVQLVRKQWTTTADLRAQRLRSQGFLVLKLDNRGSARRGKEFEAALYRKMGSIELLDQKAGVDWAVGRGLADPKRVGIVGWSYGGYMSAMALAKMPGTFAAAVAGAPVTSWDGYDTHYTERYMGLPEENEEGYRDGSVMEHASKIEGRLMLVHGCLDENVHFRHTARLVTALIHARKTYQLLAFPDERHLPRGHADRVYMEERIEAFLTAL